MIFKLGIIALGLVLCVKGWQEHAVSKGTAREPVELNPALIEAGENPPNNHVVLGGHVAVYGACINTGDQESAASKVSEVFYPVVSADHPFIKALAALKEEHGTLDEVPEDASWPELSNPRMLVKVDRFKTLSSIPDGLVRRQYPIAPIRHKNLRPICRKRVVPPPPKFTRQRHPMKGIVFTEFLEMVEAGHGMDIVDELLNLPGLSNGGSYTSVGTYEFAELASMVVKLSILLDVPMEELLRAYGVHLFGRFAATFPEMFEGQHDWREFLGGVHDRIHVEVRKLYPEAELPQFDYQLQDGCVTLEYSSPRPLAPFAEGLILGCLAHFDAKADVACELTGDKDGTTAIFKIR